MEHLLPGSRPVLGVWRTQQLRKQFQHSKSLGRKNKPQQGAVTDRGTRPLQQQFPWRGQKGQIPSQELLFDFLLCFFHLDPCLKFTGQR